MRRFSRLQSISVACLTALSMIMALVVGVTTPTTIAHAQSTDAASSQAVAQETKLTVHYRPAPQDPDGDKRGVYVWGTRTDGTTLEGQNYPFNQARDTFGKVFTVELKGKFDHVGVIITTSDWNKDGSKDRIVDTSSGSAQIWVVGGEDTTYTQPPADAMPTIKQLDVTVHYHRSDNDYAGWNVFNWGTVVDSTSVGQFTDTDDFGKIATYTQKSSSAISLSQFIVRKSADGNDWADREEASGSQSGDRTIPWSAISVNGDGTASAQVWVHSGDGVTYTNPEYIDMSHKITHAQISALNQLTVQLNHPVTSAEIEGKVSVTGASIASVSQQSPQVLVITTSHNMPANAAIGVSVEGYGSATAIAGSVVRTDAFDSLYAYNGDDLGAVYTSRSTVLKLWAPTAQSVKVNIYSSVTTDAALAKSVDMTYTARGVWKAVLHGNFNNTAYDYSLTFPDGTVNESVDPYAKASTQNSQRSVILDLQRTNPRYWRRMPAFGKATDAVISEMSVRDFSSLANSGVDSRYRGKFLGVVQKGTKNSYGDSTGLDYIKASGSTHVQIMPMYDFNNVRGESGSDVVYNWGYDPVNYNVPEGSYSTEPQTPSNRIFEAKQMIQGLHNSGIRVIMDVVYNHVFDASQHAFGKTVPGYYFRYDVNGKLVNNSGCGNDTASERTMMRKYIVDSVTYWAKEYHMDGFRFDLMGLLTKQTMKDVRSALNKIDPSLIVLGEGWDMNSTLDKSRMSIQPNGSELIDQGTAVSFFNDSIRDTIKGSVFDAQDKGFVQGKTGGESLLMNNILGCQNHSEYAPCTNGNANVKYAMPSQLIQYVEVHDNLTLYDKLKASMPQATTNDITQRDELANSIVLLSQGIPELQLGQSFLRTKGGNDNSYNSPDSVNGIDWDRLSTYKAADNYVKGLISLRKSIPALHADSYEAINAAVTPLATSNGLVAFQVKDKSSTYIVAFNGGNTSVKLDGLAKGKYTVLVAHGNVDDKAVAALAGHCGVRNARSKFMTVKIKKSYSIPSGQTLVLRKGKLSVHPARTHVPRRGWFMRWWWM
ncbi:type I pullulanase [Alloscardovia venturai]|uniref:1,4-alpha-D-glucan glucanohydrolase n=1 Tax=Alloscardovia venturai TaxID=1769421 RepID=A0ABW2Y461_9BIFI